MSKISRASVAIAALIVSPPSNGVIAAAMAAFEPAPSSTGQRRFTRTYSRNAFVVADLPPPSMVTVGPVPNSWWAASGFRPTAAMMPASGS